MSFNSKSIGDFWISLGRAYPLLVKNAMAAIIHFATTYLCESGFSSLVVIKTKSRNRLNVKDDMRVALSKTKPQFDVTGASFTLKEKWSDKLIENFCLSIRCT